MLEVEGEVEVIPRILDDPPLRSRRSLPPLLIEDMISPNKQRLFLSLFLCAALVKVLDQKRFSPRPAFTNGNTVGLKAAVVIECQLQLQGGKSGAAG